MFGHQTQEASREAAAVIVPAIGAMQQHVMIATKVHYLVLVMELLIVQVAVLQEVLHPRPHLNVLMAEELILAPLQQKVQLAMPQLAIRVIIHQTH